MDGVLIFREETTASLVRALKMTPYFPELRGIIVHDEKGWLNSRIVEGKTELPVIVFKSLRKSAGQRRKISGRVSDSQARALSPDPTSPRGLITLTMTKGGIPEPLRIAHLLAKLSVFHDISHDKR